MRSGPEPSDYICELEALIKGMLDHIRDELKKELEDVKGAVDAAQDTVDLIEADLEDMQKELEDLSKALEADG